MKDPATILLVEDDLTLLDGIADLLEVSELGFELQIMKANNGLVALEAVAEKEPDLIISDIMMPKMGGFEFLEQLRKQPDWVHIPVIFLTAKGTPDDILKGRLSGAELYITKPYDSDELLQLVRGQLDRAFELRGHRQLKLDTLSRNIVQLLNHEFRTPLTYVTAYYELLADGVLKDDPESLNEYLRGIQVGTDRLTNLIGNLVVVLELRTGAAERRIEQHSEIVTDTTYLLSSYCGERYWEGIGSVVDIQCDIPDNLPRIFIHRESFGLCLDCLLDNAIKFSRMSRDREPRIKLSAKAKDGYIAISVIDNGIGIPEHVQRRVFDLFFQFNREDLEQQGAGAGLAIVRGLTELQGGCVDVTSELGEGSTFTIYLPEYNEAALVPPQPIKKDDGRKKATILLVEDEWFLLEGLRDLLSVFGSEYDLKILTARDGQEALKILEASEPDLIISDITMPRMDGYEFLNQARKNPAWLHIPIIFLTARGEREDVLRGRRSGAEEYITKPYDAKELFAVIETQLGRHFQRQSAVEQGFEELKRSILDLLLADMNMPLGIVSEYTEKLAANVDKFESDQELMSYLQGIHSGSSQVSRLIEDFILLVELQTGKTVDWFALQARPTDVNEVLMEIGRLQQGQGKWQNIFIDRQLSDQIAPVLIDPDLLAQCLERLIDLIIALCKDCPEIGITLTSQASDGQILLTIGTQAVSLTDEEAQLVNRLLTRPEPVVLELAEYDPALLITKGVVHYHEGSIVLDVKDNSQLDFIFTFPVYQPAKEMIHYS
jgi:two-component system sensor histidine kinase/response regulator